MIRNYARSGGLHGVGSSVVNALSSDMTATVHRDGFEWMQAYKRGVPVAAVEKVKPFSREWHHHFFFDLTRRFFSRTHFNSETIKQHLEDISYIHAGLKIAFHDEAKKENGRVRRAGRHSGVFAENRSRGGKAADA